MPSVIIGDYRYSTTSAGTAMVNVVDTTKTSYGEILSSVEIGSVTYSVTSMSSCFEICTSLTTAPEIPSSVTSMSSCFRNCTSLTTAPEIPNSVTNMNYCFYQCTSLTTAPVIPSSVMSMNSCFENCTSLTGIIVVSNSPTSASDIFTNIQQVIRIQPTNANILSRWQTIANSYSDVSVMSVNVDPLINYTFLSSRRLTPTENNTYGTTHGVRIDMLLDCGDSYLLTGMSPFSGKLYTTGDNTRITFPYSPPTLLRCYLIYQPSTQVPTSQLTIQINNISLNFNSIKVNLPSTATISQFKCQDTQLAPVIDGSAITFNPQGYNITMPTGLFNVLNNIWSKVLGSTSYIDFLPPTLCQTNVKTTDTTLDTKHFVTTANNIRVYLKQNTSSIYTGVSLQYIINTLYNELL